MSANNIHVHSAVAVTAARHNKRFMFAACGCPTRKELPLFALGISAALGAPISALSKGVYVVSQTKCLMAEPILCVENMSRSLRYYLEVLGFKNADWALSDFTHVNRDDAGIYLCEGDQGRAGMWVWIGVEEVALLHEEYRERGATILHAPKNFRWAYEMKVRDPDGHVLRFGSEPRQDIPFEE